MREVKLPSGTVLRVQAAEFGDAWTLWQVFLEELKGLKIDSTMEMDYNFLKDIFCSGFSSKKFEAALKKCMQPCIYGEQRIVNYDMFEPLEARQDFMQVCFEVAAENVRPFTKSLYAEYATIIAKIKSSLV